MNNQIHSGIFGQHGFTIVEIMVAMLLGLILMAGVISLMVGNKRSFNEQIEMSRLQENARFAIEFLTRDIRMAGYAGCSSDMEKVISHLDLNDASLSPNMGIKNLLNMGIPVEGVDSNSSSGTWEASGSTERISDMATNTDAITIRFFTPPEHGLRSAMSSVSDNIIATSADGIAERGILAVSDCQSADIFQVTGLAGTATISHSAALRTSGGDLLYPRNSTADLTKPYDTDASLHRLHAARYYIHINPNNNVNPDDIPSLYRLVHDGSRIGNDPQELVAGIENMQLLYGDGNSFASADNVTNWEDINSVKIGLLVRTEDEMGTDTDSRTYNVLDQAITAAGDRHRRKVFTTTIQLRNRTGTGDP